jgi:uncharacterized membrane protein YdjX (TVP38/TMEM64 family)
MLVEAAKSSWRESMNDKLTLVMSYVQSGSVFAPLIFITFHLLRQFLFIPVIVVCMSGGVLFGAAFGTIYSVIGLTLSSMAFYFVIGKFPKTKDRLLRLKNKLFGNRKLNSRQIAVLRLIPFIHFYLLSLCLLESNKGLKNYFYLSFMTNLPVAFVYTVFGQYIADFSPTLIVIILLSLTLLIYLLREKQTVVPWKEFFRSDD